MSIKFKRISTLLLSIMLAFGIFSNVAMAANRLSIETDADKFSVGDKVIVNGKVYFSGISKNLLYTLEDYKGTISQLYDSKYISIDHKIKLLGKGWVDVESVTKVESADSRFNLDNLHVDIIKGENCDISSVIKFTGKYITFESTNSSVAWVDDLGKISSNSVGKSTILIKVKDIVVGKLNVTVKAKELAVDTDTNLNVDDKIVVNNKNNVVINKENGVDVKSNAYVNIKDIYKFTTANILNIKEEIKLLDSSNLQLKNLDGQFDMNMEIGEKINLQALAEVRNNAAIVFGLFFKI